MLLKFNDNKTTVEIFSKSFPRIGGRRPFVLEKTGTITREESNFALFSNFACIEVFLKSIVKRHMGSIQLKGKIIIVYNSLQIVSYNESRQPFDLLYLV